MAQVSDKPSPGLLDVELRVHPLVHISPSRYQGLKECALREVWAAGQQASLLPIAPQAQLGSVSHRIFEEAGAGFLVKDRAAVESRWFELVSKVEEEMKNSWLARNLVPLSSSISDYEVRKIRIIERALTLSRSGNLNTESEMKGKNIISPEYYVSSESGLVGGKIDQVLSTSEGFVIADYKTGSIFEKDNDTTGMVKPEYLQQLQLYAAMFAEQKKVWPVKLRLVPLSGQPVELEIDPKACINLLAEAEQTLEQINQVIESSPSNTVERRLAVPSSTNCSRCLFRPGCRVYRSTVEKSSGTENWPKDAYGEVQNIRRLGNAKMAISFRSGVDQSEYQIRGLTSNRHPALGFLQAGDTFGAYNLGHPISQASFGEALMTTIYQQKTEISS